MRAFLLVIPFALTVIGSAHSADPFDPFAAAAIAPRSGAAVPPDATFRNAQGRTVRLRDYLGHGPVLLVPVYYQCPNICGTTLSYLATMVSALPFRSGEDFTLLVLSIDPRETPRQAAAAATRAGSSLAAAHFLTGAEPSIAETMNAIGFRYRWNPDVKQFAHASAVATLTSDGRLTRWLYGFSYQASDVRLALVEAGDGRVGTFTDRLLLLCYHYDPQTGRYSGLVWNLLRAIGAMTALALGGFAGLSIWRERRARRVHAGQDSAG